MEWEDISLVEVIKTEDIGTFALQEVVEDEHDGLGLEEQNTVAVHRLKHFVDVDGVQLLHDGLYKLLVPDGDNIGLCILG